MPLDQQPPAITTHISDGIGLTPMLDIGAHSNVQILAKLEFQNPTGSIKDRMAKYLLQEFERRHDMDPKDNKKRTLIIPTSGNLGIAIATLAAKRKYRIIAIVPERTSNDRVSVLKALGAEILRSPNEARPEAPESAYSVAARLAEQLPDAHVLDEVALRDVSAYDDLAEEILQQTQMQLDFLVVGVETGATVTGLGNYIKKRLPSVKVIAVEPTESIISGSHGHPIRADWKLEDLGNNFTPSTLQKSVVDEWIKVTDKEAFSMARRLIRDNGVLCVVVMNDTAKNYTSTLLSDDWFFENDLADDVISRELEYLSNDRYRAASVEDLQLPAAVTITPSATASHAMDLMLEREYSQLPVINASNKKLVGYVSLDALQARLEQGSIKPGDSIEQAMFSFKKQAGAQSKYQLITPDTSLADLAKFFEKNSFAMVTDVGRKWCLGVATKYDLISFLHRRQFL
ncbi:tryptophan synthase beta subunit-like PLP-dependent enzyme [Radiomyces spectabilis]|uniref:tryptophan synthase beta subunit-like PLP-dependent enzyme n=1 Tax=Radiomyces spectabilis TaxID=64574 RepID=UPI00221EA5B8|nr:tryptophan synthase beta subunit-like PLP-dependent enzyme [Radiomyces spectabilis]KAI8377717.1 tryptophan synthase beta subunit-like PLP-dependent enzyme [Radiomyces spectabilis]